jgi:hypothetical protein
VEFCHFGADDKLAVLLAGIQVEVALVVVFGGEEVFERRDFGDDRRIKRTGFAESFFVRVRDAV